MVVVLYFLLILSACLSVCMSLCVCVWAVLPDSNKMMMMTMKKEMTGSLTKPMYTLSGSLTKPG